jgi:hypothetical protein
MPLLNFFGLRTLARLSARWFAIIGALMVVFALSGCSSLRLVYNNAPNLSLWWLDGYFDFDSDQSERMRADLQGLQKWHRAEELPLFAEMFKNLQVSAEQPVTAEQVCSLYAYMQTRAQVASERMAPALGALAPTLQPNQLDHIAREFEKRNRQWREDWMDGTPVEVTDRRVKRLVERAESFYGRLDPAQLTVLRTQLGLAGYDVQLHYREMLRRQQDALQILRDQRSGEAGNAGAQTELRALIGRTFRSPDLAFRQYTARFTAKSCAAVAAMHNSTTHTQRQRLAQTLKDYEADVQALTSP